MTGSRLAGSTRGGAARGAGGTALDGPPHITVHGRRTTLAEDSAAVRRQLLVSELVLAAVLVGAILIALWGSLPVLVVRPVIIATGAALVVLPFLITRQLRRAALPARRAGVHARR